LSIAIGGIGSSLHLAGDQFKMMGGVRILNVPYKGTAPALSDVLGGQVDMMFISLVTGTAQVRAGKLRAYGVTSAQRQSSFPDLPAIGEVVQGLNRRPGSASSGRPSCRPTSPARSMRRPSRPSAIQQCANSCRRKAPPRSATVPPSSRPSCATTSNAGRRSSSNPERDRIEQS